MTTQETMSKLTEASEALAWEAIEEMNENACAERASHERVITDWLGSAYNSWEELELDTILARAGVRSLSTKSIEEAKHAFVKTFLNYGCWQVDGYEF